VRILLVFMLALAPLSAVYAGSNDEELERLKALDAKCEQARAEKLKPLQEEKIEQCVKIDKREREWCENYFRDYGWGSTSGAGRRTERFFDQIPECVEAFDAWNNRER